jgi:hypothetical protein
MTTGSALMGGLWSSPHQNQLQPILAEMSPISGKPEIGGAPE